jgi:hypothetical protein
MLFVKSINFFILPLMIIFSSLEASTAANWNNGNSSEKPLERASPSFFIPDDIWLAFEASDYDSRQTFCNDEYTRQRISNFMPNPIPKRVKGLNSRMDNRDSVEGFLELDKFTEQFASYLTASFALQEDRRLNSAFEALYTLASNSAWLDTKSCTKNGEMKGICPPDWQDPNGQDLSQQKDWGATQARIMHLHYGYQTFLGSQITSNSEKSDLINSWFDNFYARNKKPQDIYFGLDLGWFWPEISKNYHSNPSKSKELVSKAITQLDALILNDGSLEDRTTRGNRALWYHHEALGEIFITLEIARHFDITIPKKMEEKLNKSVSVFVEGVKDPASLDRWAKKAVRSIFNPGEQKFKFRHDIGKYSWANSWFYIFMARNAGNELTRELKQLLAGNYENAKMDGMVGIGLGCIYGASIK